MRRKVYRFSAALKEAAAVASVAEMYHKPPGNSLPPHLLACKSIKIYRTPMSFIGWSSAPAGSPHIILCCGDSLVPAGAC